MARLMYSAFSDRGRVRAENEDSWFADPKQGLFIVSDGMGGHTAGALASKMVVQVLPMMLHERLESMKDLAAEESREQVLRALEDLSLHLRIASWSRPGLAGMGATVVAAIVRGTQGLIAHMGDSRAYLLRNGKLRLLTRDHSVVQFLMDAGELEPEQAATHPTRGQITRFVGMFGDASGEVTPVQLSPGDRLLLCTDGLSGLVPDDKMESILRSRSATDRICARLVKLANEAGGYDNITAMLISLAGSPKRLA